MITRRGRPPEDEHVPPQDDVVLPQDEGVLSEDVDVRGAPRGRPPRDEGVLSEDVYVMAKDEVILLKPEVVLPLRAALWTPAPLPKRARAVPPSRRRPS